MGRHKGKFLLRGTRRVTRSLTEGENIELANAYRLIMRRSLCLVVFDGSGFRVKKANKLSFDMKKKAKEDIPAGGERQKTSFLTLRMSFFVNGRCVGYRYCEIRDRL